MGEVIQLNPFVGETMCEGNGIPCEDVIDGQALLTLVEGLVDSVDGERESLNHCLGLDVSLSEKDKTGIAEVFRDTYVVTCPKLLDGTCTRIKINLEN
jgi:hypothetical protein